MKIKINRLFLNSKAELNNDIFIIPLEKFTGKFEKDSSPPKSIMSEINATLNINVKKGLNRKHLSCQKVDCSTKNLFQFQKNLL